MAASCRNPKAIPYLSLTRKLAAGQVMTIEPGLYFIDSLLGELKASPTSGAVDWSMVDAFRKFGGIRIEDDVAITDHGHENLTRDKFSVCSSTEPCA